MKRLSVKNMILVGLFGALTAVGAWVTIPLPFTPVPVTLQVFLVLLSGAVLGAYFGALSQIVYVLLGAVGLPVFSGAKGGIGVLFGPTGGYLLGFVIGAYFVGLLIQAKEKPGYFYVLCAMMGGVLFIYLAGYLQLMLITKMDYRAAFVAGVMPFIGFDVVKALFAAYIALEIKKRELL